MATQISTNEFEKTLEIQNIEYTYKDMGLRTEKNLAAHIFLENAYNGNLVPDISEVDYTYCNKGKTTLQPIPRHGPFVDDIYVYGRMEKNDVVQSTRGILATKQAATAAIQKIHAVLQTQFPGYMHAKIVQTVVAHGCTNTVQTIEKIEQTNPTPRIVWLDRQKKEGYAYFVAKISTQEIEIDDLFSKMQMLLEMFENVGIGLYCLDFSQDFSGTLVRDNLVSYLEKQGYVYQGDKDEEREEEIAGTILDNTESVGNNVCTYIETRPDGRTQRNKFYNKIVCNFEAGEVQEQFGGHLCEYVACSDPKLAEKFLHPDVQLRGMTRLEISIYGSTKENMDKEFATKLLQAEIPKEEIFVVQPARNQWNRLSAKLDRCCIFASRPEKKIWMAWYANTKTKRIAGICVKNKKIENDKEWEKTIEWVAAEFGFRMCEIFVLELLESTDQTCTFAPLRAFCKEKSSKTILAPCNRPTQMHSGFPPTVYLPQTKHVEWAWRTTKVSNRLGLQKKSFPIFQIETDKQVSTLSTKNRTKQLQAIQEAKEKDAWCKQNSEEVEKRIQEKLEQDRKRKETIYFLESTPEEHEKLPKDILRLLGWKEKDTPYGTKYFVAVQDRAGKKYTHYAGERLSGWIKKSKQSFFPGTTWHLPATEFVFGNLGYKSFHTCGKTIEYPDLRPVRIPGVEAEKLVEEESKAAIQFSKQNFEYKDAKNANEIPAGNYIGSAWGKQLWRKKDRYMLYLHQADKDWNWDDVPPGILAKGYYLSRASTRRNRFGEKSSAIAVLLGKRETIPRQKQR